tara:strand:+ start:16727 stop:17893 length:1167 start_codon:yes stop_codon:yes gene_type:complete
MKVFIAGIDGYLGWALAQYLVARGHHINGCDRLYRRKWVRELRSHSITPITDPIMRMIAYKEHFGVTLNINLVDLCDYDDVYRLLSKYRPDCIVHLGEIPSAPFSMINAHYATLTHTNNLVGTLNILYAMKKICPEAHLLKLGTMGEYGTPNVDIPEGHFELDYHGRKDMLPFPRQAGSWYHQTKVHDSNNIMMACRIWGLRSTDIMQGVVYGTRISEMGEDEGMLTRFDIDQYFGTAINRFCASAVVGHPITLYGEGHQQRGFLSLKDSMQCLTLALENPPKKGEYRTFNQFEEVYDLTELAKRVAEAIPAEIINYENPRTEAGKHYYNPAHQKLLDLGYKPTHDMRSELQEMIGDLMKYRDRIEEVKHLLLPDIHWNGTKRKVRKL